ncbi:hypothetical protein DLM45_04635 [Hyphomicrobium methylovorum]|uniref:hypothetical protein n=1 Tax=Hyphomicrobium methylovorum TaxID=84 RepID=UPI0015E70991|nr:hypothetical protein [Hyphomicrobium methylovorum]MBA2125512.1 hypothetical protein [Hyphomicrobium methylovorum]
MAIHTDPQTGRRTDTDMVAPAANNASWGIAALVVVLALLAWFAYGAMTTPPMNTTTVPQANTTETSPAPVNPAPPNANTAPETQPTAPTTP